MTQKRRCPKAAPFLFCAVIASRWARTRAFVILSRARRFQGCLLWTASVGIALGSVLACSDQDPGVASAALGGAGGGLDESPPLSTEPLYGEEGTAPSSLRLVFRAIPVPEQGSATDIAFLPAGENLAELSLLMLSRDNRLSLIELEAGVAQVRRSWDFADDAFVEYACAPTNVILDPDFESNRFIYVTKCSEAETTQLLRFVFDEEAGLSDRQVIFETTHPSGQGGWHRMGSMGFETDEILWLFVGDHDDAVPNENAQDVSNSLGALVRIMPNREPGGSGHRIPSGNFAEQPGAPVNTHPALYAYGLRSPWRGTRDSRGRFWVGDVGLQGFEEVNIIVDPGENFGWNVHEGFCLQNCEGFIDPVVAYDRSDEHRYVTEEPMTQDSALRAIWVGEIYENSKVDRYEGLMNGVVPFGDLFAGFVRGLTAGGRPEVKMDAPIGLLRDVTTWKVGPDGYAYAADLSGNLHVALLDYDAAP